MKHEIKFITTIENAVEIEANSPEEAEIISDEITCYDIDFNKGKVVRQEVIVDGT